MPVNAQLPICFKIPINTIKKWCTHAPGFPATSNVLMGLQFEFKVLGTQNSLQHVAVSQIYLTNGALTRNPISSNLQDAGCKPYAINTATSSTNGQHLEQLSAAEAAMPMLYTRFDGFDGTVDFVYMQISDFIYLKEFFSEVQLSACSLDLKSKTSSDQPGAMMASAPVFTLKLEGKGFNQTSSNTPTSGVFIGPPCPPLWFWQ